MACLFRALKREDQPAVRSLFYHAIFVPEGDEPLLQSIVDHPDLVKYWQGWGREGDLAYGALLDREWIGLAWARLFPPDQPGYGFVDKDIPELSMAVLPNFRNQGIGSKLLEMLLASLRTHKVRSLSLSVDQRNPAIRLYQRFGFRIVGTPGTDYTMLLNL